METAVIKKDYSKRNTSLVLYVKKKQKFLRDFSFFSSTIKVLDCRSSPRHCFAIFIGTWWTARIAIARKICSTRFYYCSTPFEQMTKKVKNGQQSKNICFTCISSSFTFRQKNINCSNCIARQRFWKMTTARHNL